MKNSSSAFQLFLAVVAMLFTVSSYAQQTKIQFFRPWDQTGINIFEPAKGEQPSYEGFSFRVGGSFTQQYQSLKHENDADVRLASDNKTDLNKLYPLGPGFNLAQANLNFDFQIEDGIRVSLENYMSSRHHSEFWVKGGYIQIDRLPMFGNPTWFEELFRVKLGHFQINYGDQQFRRTDNGTAIYNPFVGNYIMDGFATEIGGEVYVFPGGGFMGMIGMTAGLINGDVKDYDLTSDKYGKNPSVYLKLAYDKQFTDDFRFRLSGSLYSNSNTPRNTLYSGDRTGSRFYFAMEPEFYLSGGAITATSTSNRFTSGRLDPGFRNEITAFQINPFIKYKGLELFGAYESSKGKASNESEEREFTQFSGDLVYRFLKNEQLFIGARYNQVKGKLQGFADDISIDRTEFSAGWFPSRNLLLKAAIINQNYKDFPKSDYRSGGNFSGLMVEAVVGF